MVIIFLYADDVVLLYKSRDGLQRLFTKLYEFHTSLSLEVTLSKTKIMIHLVATKIILNREAFYLYKGQIELIHKYKHLGIGFYSHGTLSHLAKDKESQV